MTYSVACFVKYLIEFSVFTVYFPTDRVRPTTSMLECICILSRVYKNIEFFTQMSKRTVKCNFKETLHSKYKKYLEFNEIQKLFNPKLNDTVDLCTKTNEC